MTHLLRRFHLPGRVLLLLLTCLVVLTARAGAQSVRVELDAESADRAYAAFGVGGAYRPGTPVGIQVRVTSIVDDPSADAARNMLVQWEVQNADGDIAEVRRLITLPRGGSRSVWLYAPVPWDLDPSQIWVLRVFESDPDAPLGRGAEIGTATFTPPPNSPFALDIRDSAIGRIGARDAGLSGLSFAVGGPNNTTITTAHERTVVVPLAVPDLPDRAIGLEVFETIVWLEPTGQTSDPISLTAAQEEALTEWISAGGHLVIALPIGTNPWALGAPETGRLGTFIPSRRPRQVDEVPISELATVMSKSRGVDPTRSAANLRLSIQSFGNVLEPDADLRLDPGWVPMMATDSGEIIVVRRPVGHGHLTFVGLELGNPQFNSIGLDNGETINLPQADAFWNPILGRRADSPSQAELRAATVAGDLVISAKDGRLADGSIVVSQIAMREAATAGLLLALVLFVAYWLVAGPGGFAVLKVNGLVRHAWVSYVAAAAIFTGLAWVGVTAFRKRDVGVQHFTVLDWVADDGIGLPGPPQQVRARSYLSLYLPNYGDAEVALPDPSRADERAMVRSWIAPHSDRAAAFPNPARYPVDSGDLDAPVSFPARATVTPLSLDYLGPLDADWGGMLRVDPGNPVTSSVPSVGTPRLRGTLVNGLPGALSDVRIYWSDGTRVEGPRYRLVGDPPVESPLTTRQSLARAPYRVFSWPINGGNPIVAGQAFSLASPADLVTNHRLEQTVEPATRDRGERTANLGGNFGAGRPSELLKMLTVFDLLTPPNWTERGRASRVTATVPRYFGRDLDLATWLSRPCVIVVGFMNRQALPLDMQVDGTTQRGEGTVMVRWILPMQVDPSVRFASIIEARDQRVRAEQAAAREARLAERRAAGEVVDEDATGGASGDGPEPTPVGGGSDIVAPDPVGGGRADATVGRDADVNADMNAMLDAELAVPATARLIGRVGATSVAGPAGAGGPERCSTPAIAAGQWRT